MAVWFRSILLLQPDPDLMAAAPLTFQLHALAAFALIAMWPFTRLVHVFSVPLGYVARRTSSTGRATGPVSGPAARLGAARRVIDLHRSRIREDAP